MGAALAEAYKSDYLAIALTFNQGWVRAWDYTSGATLEHGTKLFRLPPPGPGTLEGMLDTAGIPLFLADVRKAPPSLSPWFDARLAMWSVSAAFVNERRARTRTVLKEAFDGLGFVRRLSSPTFTKTGERAGKREWE
jgi:erythromycin esterase-like protein